MAGDPSLRSFASPLNMGALSLGSPYACSPSRSNLERIGSVKGVVDKARDHQLASPCLKSAMAAWNFPAIEFALCAQVATISADAVSAGEKY